MTNRTECSPRKIKRIKKETESKNNNDEDSESNQLVYDFYRFLIHPMILRLNSQKDRLNYSQWLAKLDTCDEDYKMPLIKMLFISLKNNRTLKLYAEAPVDDLTELNLDLGDSTMDMLRNAQESTNEYYILENENLPQEIEHKRSAAVATDLCSYIATKTSRYLVQSFYVQSDFPIQTWYNPAAISVPNNIDHNQWELYLNRFDLLSNEMLLDFEEPHANTCESIMNLDQVQRELNSSCIFRWHPNSILYSVDRPKRSAGFMNSDQDISTQPITQQNLDESAFTIVHQKSFPGYKMLNPRIYSTIIMPDPDFVFNMTGVKITYNNVSHISSLAEDKEQIPVACPLMYDNLSTKICSVNCDEKKSIWIKPTNSSSTKKTHNKNNYQKLPISPNSTEYQQINTVKTENSCKSNDQKKTYNICDSKSSTKKCLNKSIRSECNSKSRIKCEPNMSQKKQNPCSTNTQSKNFISNQSKVKNVNKCNMSSMNGTSNSNWTLSNNEKTSVQNSTQKNSNTLQKISPIEPENQYLQYTSQNIRKCYRQNNEEPCDRTNQNNSKSKQYRENQNDLCTTHLDLKQNNTCTFKENTNKTALPSIKECLDRNESMIKPRYDENSFDPEINDYSEFLCNGGESNSHAGGNRTIQQYNKSSNNLPIDQNIISSNESCNSRWPIQTGFNESSSYPTYSNSSDSLTTLTSDLSSTESYLDDGLDFSNSTRSTKCINSTKYSNNGKQIKTDYSDTDEFSGSLLSNGYMNAENQYPFNNGKQDISNDNSPWPKIYHNNISIPNADNDYYSISSNIEDVSFPSMSYEESYSSSSFINTSQNIENMNIPNNSMYETSCSDDNA